MPAARHNCTSLKTVEEKGACLLRNAIISRFDAKESILTFFQEMPQSYLFDEREFPPDELYLKSSGLTSNDFHVPLSPTTIPIFMAGRASGWWNGVAGMGHMTSQLGVALPKKSYAVYYGAWFWSTILHKTTYNDDGFPVIKEALSEQELDFLFWNDSSVRDGWNAITEGKPEVKNYKEFIALLMIKSPSTWENMPYYDEYFAPNASYSFDYFDEAMYNTIKETINRDGGYIKEINNLLTWNTAATQRNNRLDGDKIMTITPFQQNYASDGYQASPAIKNRFKEILTPTATLPPGMEVPTVNSMVEERKVEQWNGFLEKINDYTLGNISKLSGLQWEALTGAGGTTLNNPLPGYLNSNEGSWLTWSFFNIKSQGNPTMMGFVLKFYIKFIDKVFEDAQDIDRFNNDTTIEEKWNAVLNDSDLDGGYGWQDTAIFIIYQNQENISRLAFWQTLQNVDKNPKIKGAKLSAADFQQILEDTEKANLTNKQVSPPSDMPEEPAITKEQIEGRQRFFKQCALLLNTNLLKQKFRKQTAIDARTRKKPFGGRLYMMETGEEEDQLMNDLITGNSVKNFFEVTPAEVSGMLPLLRIYRVRENGTGELEETEFVFPMTSNIDRNPSGGWDKPSQSFLDNPFDKGSGVGLKEFSFDFNGTNPATARKDITAKITLYFQSFGDLVLNRKSPGGKSYKFVDLIIQPDFNNTNEDRAPVHPDQYDPAFYRIRADVGYQKQSVPLSLKTAVEVTNNSYYLNALDHDIKVNPDGSIILTIDYRAYAEEALKSNNFDALATPKMITHRKKNLKILKEMISSGKCTSEQIQEFKLAVSAQDFYIRKQALSSIMRRLRKKHKVYKCRIKKRNVDSFRKLGYFRDGAQLVTVDNPRTELLTAQQAAAEESTVDTSNIGGTLTRENYNDPSDTIIQYFYFGDLVDTICDSMYKEDDQDSPVYGMKNIKILLGSFEFDPYGSNQKNPGRLNIGEIPISTEYFALWFKENITSKGNMRQAFPIVLFLRNLVNKLIETSLLEVCINRNVKNTLEFITSVIPAVSNNGRDPLNTHVGPNKVLLNTKDLKSKGVLPLAKDPPRSINDYYNYIALFAKGSNLFANRSGDYIDDSADGLFHIGIGSNRGIVKSVSFSKTNIAFSREARFQQNGIDGLLQLSNSYVVTIEMFGNTIFYPGMTVYVNPYGIGGTDLGVPWNVSSVAHKLGLGGYHTVTSVKTSITPGKYKTTIEAQWYWAGAPQVGAINRDGHTNIKNKPKSISKTQSPANKKWCNAKIAAAETDVERLRLESNYDSITVPLIPPIPPPPEFAPDLVTSHVRFEEAREGTNYNLVLTSDDGKDVVVLIFNSIESDGGGLNYVNTDIAQTVATYKKDGDMGIITVEKEGEHKGKEFKYPEGDDIETATLAIQAGIEEAEEHRKAVKQAADDAEAERLRLEAEAIAMSAAAEKRNKINEINAEIQSLIPDCQDRDDEDACFAIAELQAELAELTGEDPSDLVMPENIISDSVMQWMEKVNKLFVEWDGEKTMWVPSLRTYWVTPDDPELYKKGVLFVNAGYGNQYVLTYVDVDWRYLYTKEDGPQQSPIYEDGDTPTNDDAGRGLWFQLPTNKFQTWADVPDNYADAWELKNAEI